MIQVIVVVIALLIIGVACFFHFFGYKSDNLEWYVETDAEGCEAHHKHLWEGSGARVFTLCGDSRAKLAYRCPVCNTVRTVNEE